MSGNVKTSASQKIVQWRTDNNKVRIVGDGQWENIHSMTPLHLCIGQKFPKVAAEDDERLSTEKVKVLGAPQSLWDV